MYFKLIAIFVSSDFRPGKDLVEVSFHQTVCVFPSFRTDFCQYVIVGMFESGSFKVTALQRGRNRKLLLLLPAHRYVGKSWIRS